MDTPRALGRENRFLWLLGYLMSFIGASGVLMIANTTLFGLGDPKFGAGGWLIYWPVWGAVFLPVVFVASLCAELWWHSTSRRLTQFCGIMLAAYLAAMEASFVLDIQWQALLVELGVLCLATVVLARSWFAK